MPHRYFRKPFTINRIHSCWLGEAIVRYIDWLAAHAYAVPSVLSRVRILVSFGAFTRRRGVCDWNCLPDQIEPFVRYWLKRHKQTSPCRHKRKSAAQSIRNAIRQLLRLILPDYAAGRGSDCLPEPFTGSAPNFFPFLRKDRGLRETTIVQYRHYLRGLEEYLRRIGVVTLSAMTPDVLHSFVTESGETRDKRSVQSLCSILKVFLRYLYRVGLTARDLSQHIESPRRYSLAQLPRSISWEEVSRMLGLVDRRTARGRRDYAILLLLLTYGLRAREVAALSLDDFDWKRERLRVPLRKAGHSAVYPLSPAVGDAVVAYLQDGRPETVLRNLFFCALAPYRPLSWSTVSQLARRHLRKAGIEVPRHGSHTLRHTCVQRLVDSHFSLKTIGDYVGHRTPDATRIYTKVDIETLRAVALGVGEEIL